MQWTWVYAVFTAAYADNVCICTCIDMSVYAVDVSVYNMQPLSLHVRVLSLHLQY